MTRELQSKRIYNFATNVYSDMSFSVQNDEDLRFLISTVDIMKFDTDTTIFETRRCPCDISHAHRTRVHIVTGLGRLPGGVVIRIRRSRTLSRTTGRGCNSSGSLSGYPTFIQHVAGVFADFASTGRRVARCGFRYGFRYGAGRSIKSILIPNFGFGIPRPTSRNRDLVRRRENRAS